MYPSNLLGCLRVGGCISVRQVTVVVKDTATMCEAKEESVKIAPSFDLQRIQL